MIYIFSQILANGHTPLKQRRLDGNTTSIHWKENIGEFPRNFDILFRCNFDRQKIDVVSTFFFQRTFDGEKLTSFRRTFFDVILMGGKSTSFRHATFHVVLMSKRSTSFQPTFFDKILMSEKSMSFWFASFDLILMDKNTDVVPMYFLIEFWWKTDANLRCWFWFVFERQKVVVVLSSLFLKTFWYIKN